MKLCGNVSDMAAAPIAVGTLAPGGAGAAISGHGLLLYKITGGYPAALIMNSF